MECCNTMLEEECMRVIFVTVGTHEQQFDRLIKYVDDLVKDGIIKDKVIMQTGYSDYEPQYCEWQKLYPFTKMEELVEVADIVITHGGPSSIILPLQKGKVPIVVPRQKKFAEHVNNHQFEFVEFIYEKQGNVIPVWEIEELKEAILDYSTIVENIPSEMKSNNEMFCKNLEAIVSEMLIE